MVRLAFVSDDEGNLVHLLAASSHARSVVERNGYAGVDLEDATATIGRPITWLPAPGEPATTPVATPEIENTPLPAGRSSWSIVESL